MSIELGSLQLDLKLGSIQLHLKIGSIELERTGWLQRRCWLDASGYMALPTCLRHMSRHITLHDRRCESS